MIRHNVSLDSSGRANLDGRQHELFLATRPTVTCMPLIY